MNWAFWEVPADLSPRARLVLLAMADYANEENQCWPAYDKLQQKCGFARATVAKALTELIECGLIERVRRRADDVQISNLYTLKMSKKPREELSSHPSSTLSSHPSSTLSSHGYTVTQRQNPNTKPKSKEGETAEETSEETSEAEVEFPAELNTPEFQTQWKAYEAYRRENRFRPLKPSSVKAKLKEMSDWGHAQALQAINDTIANGWQGIFPPKTPPNTPPQFPPFAARAPRAPTTQEEVPRKTPWQIKTQIDAIDARRKELERHRAEAAGGEVIWDNQTARKEYYELRDKRKKLNEELINL